MSKYYLGIDLGATAIKFCQLHILENNIVIDKLHTEKIDYTYWQTKEKISKKIKEVVRKNYYKYNYVAVNIPKYAAIIKSTSYYFNGADDDIENSINYSAMQTLPEMKDKMIWDYIYFKDDANNKADINAIAVKKDFIYSNMHIFKKAKLKLDSIELTSTAMNNYYFANYSDYTNKISLLIDIGYTVTTVNIIYYNRPILFWSMPFGIKSMVKSVQESINCSEEEIISHLFENGYIENNDISRIAFSQIEKLMSELELPLNSFSSNYDDAQIDRIIISGGGAKIKDIEKYISGQKGIPAEISLLNENIQIKDGNFVDSGINFNVAIGLCLKQFINYEKELNLIVPVMPNPLIKYLLKYETGIAAALIILFFNMTVLKNKTDFYKNEIRNYNYIISSLRGENSSLKAKIESMNKVSVIHILNILEKNFDDKIRICQFQYDNTGNLVLSFRIRSKSEAAMIIEKFRNLESLHFMSFDVKEDLTVTLKPMDL